jgi:hypothetical protein
MEILDGRNVARRWMIGFIASLLGLLSTQAGAQVVTKVYSSYADNNSHGVTFMGTPTDTISTVDFDQFGAAVSWSWNPGGLSSFGADSLGYIDVPVADSFTFNDAGTQIQYLFVDGTLAFTHNSFFVGNNQTTITLAPGLHSVEVQYETVYFTPSNGQGPFSGYEMAITPTTGFTFVPEPASVSLLVAGAFGLLLHRRK